MFPLIMDVRIPLIGAEIGSAATNFLTPRSLRTPVYCKGMNIGPNNNKTNCTHFHRHSRDQESGLGHSAQEAGHLQSSCPELGFENPLRG